jgi:hypothetical protein
VRLCFEVNIYHMSQDHLPHGVKMIHTGYRVPTLGTRQLASYIFRSGAGPPFRYLLRYPLRIQIVDTSLEKVPGYAEVGSRLWANLA